MEETLSTLQEIVAVENGEQAWVLQAIYTGAAILVWFAGLWLVARLRGRLEKVRSRLAKGRRDLGKRLTLYINVTRRVLQLALTVLIAAAIMEIWGLAAFNALASETSQVIIFKGLRVFAIVGVGTFIGEFLNTVLQRSIEKAAKSDEKKSRAKTLLPLIRNTLGIVIGLLVVLSVLAELGVNIGPLLAGAGVLGLAVGFGAQTLVKDIITGLFIVLEGIIRIDDVVEVAGRAGAVERITIRTIVLRDLAGDQHTIPWSSVDTVRNMTMLFSVAMIECGVAYREDVQEVKGHLKDLCDWFATESEFKDKILEEPLIDGVTGLGDSAVVLRVRIKTQPGEHWALTRAFNERMKEVFDENDIEIPFPHHVVYFGEGKTGEAPAAPIKLLGQSDGKSGGKAHDKSGEKQTRKAS